MSTPIQTAVVDALSKGLKYRYYQPGALGAYETVNLDEFGPALQPMNAYRMGDVTETVKLLDDDDQSSDIGVGDTEEVRPEVEKALNTIYWVPAAKKGSDGRWQTRVLCARDIMGRVLGREKYNISELEAAYPGLCIELEQNKNYGSNAGQKNRVRLSQGATFITMSHDSDKIKLAEARLELEELVSKFRSFAAYTHFISLPILLADNVEFPGRLREFFKRLDDKALVNDVRIMMPLGMCHYTLIMLRLYTDDEIAAVIKVIQKLKSPLFGDEVPVSIPRDVQPPPKGFLVHLKGVYCMDEDETQASVLYTKEVEADASNGSAATNDLNGTSQFKSVADPSVSDEPCNNDPWLRLRRSAHSYLDALVEDLVAGLLSEGVSCVEELVEDRLIQADGSIQRKLHITLLNRKLGDKKPFNARLILDDPSLRNFDFGNAIITGLHLSRRGEPSPDTFYYHPEFVRPLRPHVGL
ncbi:AKAP7 2'5' RNA ligase-like domain protein [Gregarina niphandrodes]|uniref:AKAP7 2'5' RNA ligase-like domain protein n=1 Tax=Gregarina niphandrodes TaxID=110365 RepID=A0A023B8R7_GRENI|nr:AKAP7 2'5' RNA ligase-like domain protein [Gregarina niphandrodes]EZG69828.1 AKAP7 2'5' RNA ligase-like domain protein [Gregarina niphandrodes]|eukprot:XP_011129986.1 AKAP7 2'5' RNA ligase-like domain protein [Gregarina niphandrodes]